MNVTPNQLATLRAISNLQKLELPCTDEIRTTAAPLVELGWVVENEGGELHVPDDIKWQLLAAGHVL